LTGSRPDLTLVYLPHLDYDPQRFGPSGSDIQRLTGELDAACIPLLDAAAALGARVWVVSEYGHADVSHPVPINLVLRQAARLGVGDGAFGEVIETFQRRGFAVCDHQVAHVYVAAAADRPAVRELLAAQPGVSRVLEAEERAELGLEHPRAGELVVLSEPDA